MIQPSLTDPEIQQIIDRVILALQDLAPGESHLWDEIPSFAPVAILIAAGLAFWLGWRTLNQKKEADSRSEWWRRTQWALDATISADTRMYGYGAGILDLLATSTLADKHDKELLDAVWESTSTEMEDEGIQILLNDAGSFTDVSEGEAASVNSFYFGDPVAEVKVDDVVKPAVVDENPETQENESRTEDVDGKAKEL